MHLPAQNFVSSEAICAKHRCFKCKSPAKPALKQQSFHSLTGEACFHEDYKIRTNTAIDSRKRK